MRAASRISCRALIAFSILSALCAVANGDVIVSNTAPQTIEPNGFTDVGIGFDNPQFESSGFGWSQTSSWDNVSISGLLVTTFPFSGTAYLMGQIGTRTGTDNQIASAPVMFAAGSFGSFATVNLFSGLTLGPGTYYVVVGSPTTQSGWGVSNSLLLTEGNGVTSLGNFFYDLEDGPGVVLPPYIPGGPFGSTSTPILFQVSGDLTSSGPTNPTNPAGPSAPEPAMLFYIGLGFAGLGVYKAKQRIESLRTNN